MERICSKLESLSYTNLCISLFYNNHINFEEFGRLSRNPNERSLYSTPPFNIRNTTFLMLQIQLWKAILPLLTLISKWEPIHFFNDFFFLSVNFLSGLCSPFIIQFSTQGVNKRWVDEQIHFYTQFPHIFPSQEDFRKKQKPLDLNHLLLSMKIHADVIMITGGY